MLTDGPPPCQRRGPESFGAGCQPSPARVLLGACHLNDLEDQGAEREHSSKDDAQLSYCHISFSSQMAAELPPPAVSQGRSPSSTPSRFICGIQIFDFI